MADETNEQIKVKTHWSLLYLGIKASMVYLAASYCDMLKGRGGKNNFEYALWGESFPDLQIKENDAKKG